MSDGDKPASSEKKWDLSNPQILLTLVGIVVGAVCSVFGVALAMPLGQDLLCNSYGVACPHFKMSNALLDVSGIDYKAYCEKEYAGRDTGSLLDQPSPGFEKAIDACEVNFANNDPPGFFMPVLKTGVVGSPGNILVVHFQMAVPPQRINVPFTLRTECRRGDDAIQMMSDVPCKLSPPIYGPYQTGALPTLPDYSAPENVLPDGTLRTNITKDKGSYVGRWRLDIEGSPNAGVRPGVYSVTMIVGGAGEPIDDAVPSTVFFTLYPSPSAPPAGTN